MMVGGENFEEKKQIATETNEATNIPQSEKITNYLKDINNETGANKAADALKNDDNFNNKIAWYAKRWEVISEGNRLVDDYNKHPATVVEVHKFRDTKNYKAEDILPKMWKRAKEAWYTNVGITNKITNQENDPILISIKGENKGEAHGLTYLKNCSYWNGSGSNENCIIHEYQNNNGWVDYADPPIKLS